MCGGGWPVTNNAQLEGYKYNNNNNNNNKKKKIEEDDESTFLSQFPTLPLPKLAPQGLGKEKKKKNKRENHNTTQTTQTT